MKYLSIDIEATGLGEHDYIIEFAAVPFCTETNSIKEDLGLRLIVSCPSFDVLKPSLNQWVIDHNKELIDRAFNEGISLSDFKSALTHYLNKEEIKTFFGKEKIVLFGKSMNAIDLPFMKRDLGWDFMNEHFHHRILDLSSFTLGLIDAGLLPKGLDSGSKLMEFFNMGEVLHTALEDAVNTAKMYLKILELLKNK